MHTIFSFLVFQCSRHSFCDNFLQKYILNTNKNKDFGIMFSDRSLIEEIIKRNYTFKPCKIPKSFNLNTSKEKVADKVQNQTVNTWHDLAKIYCKQILKIYPYQEYKSQYDQEVCLIQSELKFRNSTQPGVKWTLLKSKDQINKFTKKWYKNQPSNVKQPQNNQNGLFNILSEYSATNKKDHQIFQEFLEQMIPKDKANLKVLGQYKVIAIEAKGVRNCIVNNLCSPCKRSDNYYISITNENLLLSEDTLIDNAIEEAIPYTNSLEIEYELSQKQTFSYPFVIRITSGRTHQVVSFTCLFDLLRFSFTFGQVKANTPYFVPLRFQSFSPQRQNNWTKLYSDSQDYFSDLHDQIQKAQKKICITGWCISPYILLKRPQKIQNGESRLDKTLTRAAKRGVKVFIIVFQQPSLLLNNDSYNVWHIFEKQDENFKVLRHPGLIIPQLWSHHEKCCIIDQKVAFMGGLDICYGRWDTHDHPIDNQGNLWEGADYNNQRQRSITKPRQYWQSNLDKETQPRMPWHDIAIQFKGPTVIDLQRHFVQYWYFAIRDLSDDPRDYLFNFRNRYKELKRQHAVHERQRTQQEEETFRNTLFSKVNPTPGEMALIQCEYVKLKKNKPEKNQYSFQDRVRSAKMAFKDLIQNKTAIQSKQVFVQGFGINSKPGNMKLQLCRSSSTWSTGIKKVECSIYNAYLHLIKNSKQLIYIQNQFFMSHQNLISETLAERIKIAYIKKQKFKVIVMMPLLPGFEGDVTQQSAGVLRIQMQLQYEAISRDPTSIVQILKKEAPEVNIFDYMGFYGVRAHGLMGKNKDIPKTQIIYIHSKLMIVDDKFIICGSANINDRSLLGLRDSQLAMVIEDPNGSIGKGQIFDFRCRIFKEHFNMSESNCANLHSYWSKLNDTAKKNTLIYRQVFGCYPDDTASKYSDVARLQKQAIPALYKEKVRDIYGHYVEWPLQFLKAQNLHLKFGQLQYLAPITSFT